MKKTKYLVVLVCLLVALFVFAIGCTNKKSDPFDESGFQGTTNNESKALETDDFITIDGKFDDTCWKDQKVMQYTYEGLTLETTTVFGELGFYVGFRVDDKHVYSVKDRDVWKGASFEMYVHRDDTDQKNENTFQYRIAAYDNRVEAFSGYVSPEGHWTWKNLPIYGLTQVQGEVNSGNTQGATAEIFVRWDALGYDYTAQGFVAPEQVKIYPVYNQSSGADKDSNRTFWVHNSGSADNTMDYWVFDKDGFTDADATGSTIGRSAYGREKSSGWDVSREADGIVTSDLAGEQTIFFQDVYAEDYMVTTMIDFKTALNYWKNNEYVPDPYPKAGLIIAADKTKHAYLLDFETAQRNAQAAKGMFFQTGNPDSQEGYWRLFNADSLSGKCDTSKPVRLTAVKKGANLLIYVGDEHTDKFGGAFVAMQQVSAVAGKACPGFFTMGGSAEFSSYEVNTDPAAVDAKISGQLSLLTLNQAAGGILTSDKTGHLHGDKAVVTIETYDNYRLKSIKVNGVEKKADIVGGKLQVDMNADRVTVVPVFEAITGTLQTVKGTLQFLDNSTNVADVDIFITDQQNSIFYMLFPQANGSYEMELPSGDYQAVYRLNGIFKHRNTFTVASAQVNIPTVEIKANQGFNNPNGIAYRDDGDIVMTATWQSRYFKNVATAGTGAGFTISTDLEREDGNFTVEGTWETGGIAMSANGLDYKIYVMREHSNSVVVYLYTNKGGDIVQEYRQGGTYQGTGAPIRIDLAYYNREIHLLLDGVTHYVLNADNTSNPELKKLFTTDDAISFGFGTMGRSMVYSNFSYSVDASDVSAALDAMQHTIAVPDLMEGGSVSADADKVFKGETVSVTVTLDDGYVIDSFMVNGVDKKDEIIAGKYVVDNLQEDLNIQASFSKIPMYTVSGTFGYATGLYHDGDVVTVQSGAISGTIDTDSMTYSISLPNGQHTISLISQRFREVKISVTVANGAIVSNATNFQYVKLESDDKVTFDNGKYTLADGQTYRKFANITSKTIEIDLQLERNDGVSGQKGTWNTGAIGITVGDETFRIFAIRPDNDGDGDHNRVLNVFVNNMTNWAAQEFQIPFPSKYSGTGDPIRFKLTLTEQTLYLRINDATDFVITAANLGDDKLKRLFTDELKTFGLFNIDLGVAYSEVSYRIPVSGEAVSGSFFTDNSGVFKLTDDTIAMSGGKIKTFADAQGNAVKTSGNFMTEVTLRRGDHQAVNGTWNTAGVTVQSNGNDYKLYFIYDDWTGATLLWFRNETQNVGRTIAFPYLYDGTGAPISFKVAYVADEAAYHIQLGGKHYQITAEDVGNEAGLLDAFDAGKEKSFGLFTNFAAIFSGFSYNVDASAVTAEIGSWDAVTEFAHRDNKAYFTNNEFVTKIGANTISITANDQHKVFAGAEGAAVETAKSFMSTYTLRRCDRNYGVGGTWETGGFYIRAGEEDYRIYVMREDNNNAVVYFRNQSKDVHKELRVPYNYRGTGAPLKVSLAYDAADASYHLYLNETHYAFNAANLGIDALNAAFDSSISKKIGFCTIGARMVFEDFSYSVTESEVSAQIAAWGESVLPRT